MAYGLTWWSEFDDLEERVYRVEVLQNGFSGESIEVLSGKIPFVSSWMDDASKDPFYAMRTQKAEIQWISDEISGFEISDLFIVDQQQYKVIVYEVDRDTDDKTIIWQGYLVPTDSQEPYASKPYTVSLSASCGLALLRDQYFLDANGRFVEGTMSLFNIIRNCLSRTGLNLPIDIQLGIVENNDGTSIVPSLSLTYIDADGLRGMKAFDVLEGILNSINAFITQEDGKWVIKGVRELTADEIRSYRFNWDGSGYEFSDVSQLATVGRAPLDIDTPNLLPTSEIDESLAVPVSFITNELSPGIAVNRLTNGTFSPAKAPWGEAFMSSMDSWAPDPESWGVQGDGKPDDPYRYVSYGSVRTTGDIIYRSGGPQYNVGIYNTPVITIRRDGDKNFYPNLKIVVSGAFRCRDGARFMISARLNDGDRDWVSWLDENGKWTDAKKVLDRQHIKISVDTPHNPDEFKLLKDMPLQTFEIESSKITNFIERPGGWIARLYFTIHPATSGSDSFPEISNDFSPALWLEDICVTVTTGTIYEGNHGYQIDGKKIIRNGEDYKYRTIIGDKIGILTPEQKHDDRRVMTGYTSIGISELSDGWVRVVDGVATGPAEPMQHLTLRERLRLLCGKRPIIEGDFYGHGVKPTNTIVNQIEGDDSYFQITGWAWDLKNRIYNLRLHQLDFTPLADEVITLSSERSDPGRGNRLYSGASGSVSNGSPGSGSGVSQDEIKLDDPETVQYIAGKADTVDRVFDLGILIQSGHAPGILEAKIINFPPWIASISIDQGEDTDTLPEEGILLIKWRGKPTTPGNYQIVVELTNAYGEDYLVVIPIYVNSVPKIKFSVLDTFTPKTLGGIPGAYKLPDMVDISATVTGYHNNFQMALYGPSGLLMDEFMYADGGESELQTYNAFPNTDGIVPEEGLYKIVYNVQSNMIIVDQGTLFFTLYTDEYLSKLKFELWNTVKIGDISIQDTSIFKPVVWFTPRAIADDIEHDKVTLTLYYEGEQIAQEVFTHTATFSGTYDVYDTAQTGQDAGNYRVNAVFELSGDVVMERQNDFVILAKDPVADGTIKFGTMTANTANFNAVQDLPVSAIQIDLPTDGYNFEYTTVGGDYVRVEFLRKTGAVLTAVDVTKYTNQPDYTTVSDLGEKVYAFRTLSSKEIGNLHAPSTVKVRFTERLGGAAGSILSIAEANVKFRVPVDPAELGGLNFIHINNDTAEIRVIDPNMKKVGNVYALPKMPWYWSVAFIKLPTNLEFDRVVGGLKLGGVELHTPGKTGVFDYPVTTENGYPGNVTTKLNTALEAFVAGTWAGTHRTLLNPSDVAVNIDVTGSFKFESVVARLGTPIAFPSAEFELKNEEDIEAETPEEEDGGCCEPKRWNFVALSVWDIPHNMDGYPEFNLIIEGEKWDTEIKYPDSNNAQAVWNRPRTGFAEAK